MQVLDEEGCWAGVASTARRRMMDQTAKPEDLESMGGGC